MANRSKDNLQYGIEMLWAHQLRRENQFLHKKLESLRAELTKQSDAIKASQTDARSAQVSAENSCSLFKTIEVDHGNLRAAFESSRTNCEENSAQLSSLKSNSDTLQKRYKDDLKRVENDIRSLQQDVSQIAEIREENISIQKSITFIQDHVKEKADISVLNGIERRVIQLEERPITFQAYDEAEIVPEDGIGGLQKRAFGGKSRPISGRRGYSGNEAQNPTAPTNEAGTIASDSFADVHLSSVPDDIDLDSNAGTSNYARVCYPNSTLNEPIQLRSEKQYDKSADTDDLQNLKQDKFYSWTRYCAEGKALTKRLQSGVEQEVVRKFVQGIYFQKHKEHCVRWLDTHGWTWDSIDHITLPDNLLSDVDLDIDATPRETSNPEQHLLATETQAEPNVPDRFYPRKTSNCEIGKTHKHSGGTRRSQRILAKGIIKANNNQDVSLNPYTKKSKMSVPRKTPKTKRRAAITNSIVQNEHPVEAINEEQFQSVDLPKRDIKGRFLSVKEVSSQVPKIINGQPSGEELAILFTPEHGQQPQAGSKVHIPARLEKETSAYQSANYPIPRLVKRKFVVSDSVTRDVDPGDRSSEELKLPSPPPRAAVEHQRPKKRRVRLPPPPEIPILPTSQD